MSISAHEDIGETPHFLYSIFVSSYDVLLFKLSCLPFITSQQHCLLDSSSRFSHSEEVYIINFANNCLQRIAYTVISYD